MQIIMATAKRSHRGDRSRPLTGERPHQRALSGQIPRLVGQQCWKCDGCLPPL